MPISDVLRPIMSQLLISRVAYLVKGGRFTAAKQTIIWGHSYGYLTEAETERLIGTHGLAAD